MTWCLEYGHTTEAVDYENLYSLYNDTRKRNETDYITVKHCTSLYRNTRGRSGNIIFCFFSSFIVCQLMMSLQWRIYRGGLPGGCPLLGLKKCSTQFYVQRK